MKCFAFDESAFFDGEKKKKTPFSLKTSSELWQQPLLPRGVNSHAARLGSAWDGILGLLSSHQRCPPRLRFQDGSCCSPPLPHAKRWELAPRQPSPVLSYLQHLCSDKNAGSTPRGAGANTTISSGPLSSPLCPPKNPVWTTSRLATP